MNKILSIIIPCYNSEKFIEKAIKSIYKNNFIFTNKIEVIVVNDGSNDSTKTLLLDLKREYESLKIFNKKNGNWGSVINFIKNNKIAIGKYITILDSDDWYFKNSLEKIEKYLNKDYDLILNNFSVKKNGKTTKKFVGFFRPSKKINKKIALTPFSMPLGKFIRKEIFYKTMNLKEKVGFQDMILYNEIVFLSKKIFYFSKSIGVWNLENENSSTNLPWTKEKVQIFIDNLDFISKKFNSKAHKGYCIYYYLFLEKYLKKFNYKINFQLKDTKLYWLFPILRTLSKIFFYFKLRKYFKK